MVLAVGIVVDDAIVVVENVERIMEEEPELSIADATKKAAQVTAPIIGITLVLMLVFVPVAFIPRISGELFRQFAVTISAAVLIPRSDLTDIHIRNDKGTMVPLQSIASVRFVTGPQVVTRYNNYQSVTVNGGPAPGVASGTALLAMSAVSAKTLPPGYTFEWTTPRTRSNVSTPVFVGMIAATCGARERSSARFRRNVGSATRHYVNPMIIAFDIDPRIARLCAHAGRLQLGT